MFRRADGTIQSWGLGTRGPFRTSMQHLRPCADSPTRACAILLVPPIARALPTRRVDQRQQAGLSAQGVHLRGIQHVPL